jgi:hypothetical protein
LIDVRAVAFQQVSNPVQPLLDGVDPAKRRFTGQRLDAANPGRDPGFGYDLEQSDIARPVHVGAATQFGREIAKPHHAHLLVVFLSKQCHGTGRERIVYRHRADIGLCVGPDLLVYQRLDLVQLRGRDGLGMREIETQSLRGDQRALLRQAPSPGDARHSPPPSFARPPRFLRSSQPQYERKRHCAYAYP